MRDRPRVGHPLPGANRAYSSSEKWLYWILAARGHGNEWNRVFRAGPDDIGLIWAKIAHAVQRAPIIAVRDRGRHGLVCSVAVTLTVHARTAVVMTSWHYGSIGSTPRLVTAYPSL